jgi:hypothetical protein
VPTGTTIGGGGGGGGGGTAVGAGVFVATFTGGAAAGCMAAGCVPAEDPAGAGCAAFVGAEEGAVDPDDAAGLDGAGAVWAGGCDACSGVDGLLLHPVLQRNAAGRRSEAATVILLDIEPPQHC